MSDLASSRSSESSRGQLLALYVMWHLDIFLRHKKSPFRSHYHLLLCWKKKLLHVWDHLTESVNPLPSNIVYDTITPPHPTPLHSTLKIPNSIYHCVVNIYHCDWIIKYDLRLVPSEIFAGWVGISLTKVRNILHFAIRDINRSTFAHLLSLKFINKFIFTTVYIWISCIDRCAKLFPQGMGSASWEIFKSRNYLKRVKLTSPLGNYCLFLGQDQLN